MSELDDIIAKINSTSRGAAIDHEELLNLLLVESRRARVADKSNMLLASSSSDQKNYSVRAVPTSSDEKYGDVVAEYFSAENFAADANHDHDHDEFGISQEKWDMAVQNALEDLIDPTEINLIEKQLMQEFYPHHVGASDYDPLIETALAEFSNSHSSMEISTRTATIPSPQITLANNTTRRTPVKQPDSVLQNFENLVCDLNLEDISEPLPEDFLMNDQESSKYNEADQITKDLNSFVSTSGAVSAEELLDTLLREGRRILWEKLEQDRKQPVSRNVNRTVRSVAAAPPPSSTSNNEKLSAREREMVKEMYGRITNSGAADADGMIEYLLSEVLGKKSQRQEETVMKSKL